tara:strand:+ start:5644 stop:6540 length:897 start_codon:yes stop_codon:yes gene_type:complete
MRFVIIIPYKNEYNNLKNIFRDIINQKKKFSEVIFVNDRSTDASYELVNSLIGKRIGFKNLNYKSSKSMFDVLNFGLKNISNKKCFVLPGSANDGFFNNMLQIAYNDLKKNPNVGFWSSIGYYKIGNKYSKFKTPILSLKKNFNKGEAFLRKYFLMGNFIVGASCLYNLKYIMRENFFQSKLLGIADLDMYKKIGYKYGHIYHPKRLCYVTKHKGQFSYKTYNSKNFSNVVYLYKKNLISFINLEMTNKLISRIKFLKYVKFSEKKKFNFFVFIFLIKNFSFFTRSFYFRNIKNLFIS